MLYALELMCDKGRVDQGLKRLTGLMDDTFGDGARQFGLHDGEGAQA